MVLGMTEPGAPRFAQIPILMSVPLMLLPAMQLRPTLFDFLALSAIVALLSRHNWRASAPLWLAIPLVAIWSNLHGGCFLPIVVVSSYCPTGLIPSPPAGALPPP